MISPLQWIKENLIFLPLSGPSLKGQKVGTHILDFQSDIIKSALNEDGSFNKNVFMGFSRKISKSMIFSWIFNYLLEKKEGMTLVNMASTFSQSNIIFSLIANQIKLNRFINEEDYTIRRDYISNNKKHNTLNKIYSSASSNLGMLNVSCLIADEVGAMQSRENLNSILSGLSMAQGKPLLLFASNPSELPSHWSNDYLKTLRKDKDWVFYDFSANPKLDPHSKKAKMSANPFYAEYVRTKNPILKSVHTFIDKESQRAKQSSENLVVYKRFQLGQRVSARAHTWVDVNHIKIADEKVLKDKSLRAILSFDLALSWDFCSCVLCLFNEKTEDIYLYPFLHIATTQHRPESQQVKFKAWHDQGHITIQGYNAINKSLFIAEIKEFLKKWDIKPEKYVWDRALSTGWTEEFSSDPLLIKGTAFELSHAIRFIEARSKEGKLHFIGKNPALKTMFDSAYCSVKSKGYTLLDRATSRESIDGAVCCVLGTKYFIENRKQNFTGFSV